MEKWSVLKFEPNIAVPQSKPLRFMIAGAANIRDGLAHALHVRLARLHEGNCVCVGMPHDGPSCPNTVEVRVCDYRHSPHQVATDVWLRTIGADLYVEIEGSGRSPVRFARPISMACIWLLVVLFIFTRESTFTALLLDFAESKSSDALTYAHSLKYGTFGESWTVWTLFANDPLLVLTRLAAVTSLIALVFWLLAMYRPDLFIRPSCAMLNWPRPEQLHGMIKGQASWVHSEVSNILLEEFGFDERHCIVVN